MNWQWVLYWAAIFNAMAFVFLVFFLEETNYSRPSVTTGVGDSDTTAEKGEASFESKGISSRVNFPPASASVEDGEADVPRTHQPTKRYIQKLRLFEPGVFSRPNRVGSMMVWPLYFFSFPIIFWCGVCYGSALGTLLFSFPGYW